MVAGAGESSRLLVMEGEGGKVEGEADPLVTEGPLLRIGRGCVEEGAGGTFDL